MSQNYEGQNVAKAPAELISGKDSVDAVHVIKTDTDGNLQVDVLTSGGQYAEDSPHADGNIGTQVLAVRKDTATALAGADGDYIPLIVDGNGRLHTLDQNSAAIKTAVEIIDDWDETDRAKVNLIAGQVAITAAAGPVAANTPRVTHASDDPVTTAVQVIDNAIHTGDVAVTGYATVGAVYDDTTPVAVTENQTQSVRMSSRRELYTQLRDAAGNERGANVNASNALLTVQTGELPAGTQNIGDVDIVSLPNEGQQTMANSISVAIALDQSNLPVAASHTRNEAFTESFAVGGELDDTAPVVATEGNVSPARITAQRAIHVNLRDNAGAEIGTATDPVNVEGTVTANQGGTWNITNVSGVVSLPTGASTLSEQQSQTTALQLIDDVVHASDAALGKVAAVGAQFDDTSPGTTTENNIRPLRMSTRRELYSQIRDAAGNERGVNINASNALLTTQTGELPAGTQNIGDVDVVSVIPGVGATNLGKAIDTATGTTDTGVLTLATRDDGLSALTPIEGDNVQLRVDANGALWTHDDALDAALGGSELQVDIVASLPAGTNAIGKLAANSGVDIGDVDILSIAAGNNNIGDVDIASLPNEGQQTMANSISVAISSDQSAVPISSNALTSTIHASAAETITGNSGDVDASNYSLAVFYLNVSAASGTTPTLDVIIEGKDPVASTYYTIVTFIQKVTTGSERITLAILADRTIRGKWTIGGTTPSFTFSLIGVLKS